MERKVDKVLQGEILILIIFNVKAFSQINLQVNSQQMWMTFHTFPKSSCVNCDLDKGLLYEFSRILRTAVQTGANLAV